MQPKTIGVLVKALQAEGLSPTVLLSYAHVWARRLFRAFGIREFIYWEEFEAAVPEGLKSSAQELLAAVDEVRDLISLTYRDVEVGRWALSTLLRQLKSSRMDLGEPGVRQSAAIALRDSMRAVHIAEKVLGEVCPHRVMFYEKGYTPFGELFSSAVSGGVDVIQWLHSQRSDALILKRYTEATRSVHPSSLSAASWNELNDLPWPIERGRFVQEQLRVSYGAGTWFNRKFLLEKKEIKTAQQVTTELGLDPEKKTAIIFSHVLWDATFFYGINLFRDYEEWLVETVKAACHNPSLNWVVKIHPDYVWKLKRELGEYSRDMLGEYLAIASEVGDLPSHISILDAESDISTFSLFAVTDYCLTVRGTIGMEMPCFGIPVFTAGTGRYSGFGFTHDSESTDEYLEKLARLHEFPPLDEEQTALAQRHAYGVFFLRPLVFQSFAMVRGEWADPSHPLSHDVRINADSLEELLSATDMNAFAGWTSNPLRLDYLSPLESSGVDGTAQERS